MQQQQDLIIAGSGPAGLAAAVYAARARMRFFVLEENDFSGGQIINTYDVDNYLGLPGIGGFDLAMKFREHADKFGAQFVQDRMTAARREDGQIVVQGEKAQYRARALLVATGARHRRLGCPGEAEFSGRGVSYCATCDGAFFRGKDVAMVGGGDTALEEAAFLANLCARVYLLHRRDALRASKHLQERVLALPNVEVLYETTVQEIFGGEAVEGIRVLRRGRAEEIPLSGVFIAVGMEPNSEPLRGVTALDSAGFIVAGEDGATSVPGLFAAGDVRTKALRQILTAAADGANAIRSIERYLLGGPAR